MLIEEKEMTWFLQSIDFYLWDIIKDGPNIPTKVENVVFVPKPRKELDELDKRKNQLHAKVVYFLYYVIDRNEYNRIY